MINCKWGVLDTETTGFYAGRGDRLVEIAAIKLEGNNLENRREFCSLINPERKIPPAATRVHKIVDEMLVGKPLFADIADEFFDFVSDVDYLFIHNAQFDLSFIKNESERVKKLVRLPKIVCSVNLSRELYPFERSHNLNAIAKRNGLSIKEGEGRHRALGDVIMTAEAILKFAEDNPLTFQGTIENLYLRG